MALDPGVSLPTDQTPEDEAWQALKLQNIKAALLSGDGDRLRALAVTRGGFLTDEVRREAWPMLLGHCSSGDDETAREKPGLKPASWRDLKPHHDEDQVHLDVDRSFIYYPNDQSQADMKIKKSELADLIIEVLRRHPFLCYFQGYHDICQVLLLVLPADRRADAVTRLSLLRIRDFMLPTLDGALAQLALIPAIIQAVDPKLCRHLSETQPFFALSDTLTMYAHNIETYGEIARLFDVFLAKDAVFTVYMFAQIVLRRKLELFDTPATEPEMLHSILSKLPKPLDIEALIQDTVALIASHPPEQIRRWSAISRYSALKTTRAPADEPDAQTLHFGRRCFERQVYELQRVEQRKRILMALQRRRGPVLGFGLAVTVVLVAIWLRKDPAWLSLPASIWQRLRGHR